LKKPTKKKANLSTGLSYICLLFLLIIDDFERLEKNRIPEMDTEKENCLSTA